MSTLDRMKGDNFGLIVKWFRVPTEPPEQFGKFSDLVTCLAEEIGEKDAVVTARFSYDRGRMASVFSPIPMDSKAGIFDEIVGFTGVRRSAEGQLLYKLEVTLGAKRLEHKVTFFESVRLSEELPLKLLSTATKISDLGLKRSG